MLVDTHAHIHSKNYGVSPELALENAKAAAVTTILCVGTDHQDSALAVDFAEHHSNCWAAIGLHPHDAKQGPSAYDRLNILVDKPKVVAVGECGLDYYYSYSARDEQLAAFRHQLKLASQFNKPLIFHIREAFDDFFNLIADFPKVRGVIHSFTADTKTMDKLLQAGFYIGLNGIMTFTKIEQQQAMAKQLPLNRLLLETDSPFLTPAPKRGTINEPANVRIIADFLAKLRGEGLQELASATTHNAKELFKL